MTTIKKAKQSLLDINPSLVNEWDYSNNDIKPENISPNSHIKIWWKCNTCNYNWQATLNDRSRGRNCPKCAPKKRTQARNQTLLKEKTTKILSNYPQLISEWDNEKNCIDPSKVLSGSHQKAWWKCLVCGNSWQATIGNRVRGSGCPKCKKHNRTSFPEQALYFYLSKAFPNAINSYTEIFNNRMEIDIYIPNIKTGIEYDGKAFHSGKKAEYEMEKKYQLCKKEGIKLFRISEFDNQTTSYDFCLIREDNTDMALSAVIVKLLTLLNVSDINVNISRDRAEIMKQYITVIQKKSISYRYPNLIAKWDVEKNNGLLPNQVNAYSNKRFWWKCPLGHSYQAVPYNEAFDTKTCPICSNHRVLQGFNDLATKAPSLAKEWDETLNYPKKTTDVIYTSSKKYWWRCEQGHSYLASLSNRYYGSTGCPYCSSRKILVGFNDLATTNPKLAQEWNYTKNDELTPEKITSGSSKKVWWKCSQGHEWIASISARNGKDSIGCPYCTNQKVLAGYNDLATTHPFILDEWNYDKNAETLPTNVVAGSTKKVWWKCKTCNNEWEAGIAARTKAQKTGCPICGYKIRMQNTIKERIVKEHQSLMDLFPEIASEWDIIKNDCIPSEVAPSANIKVWWICSKGHSYQSWLSDKTGKHKVGCPICNGKKLLTGENDLESLYPEIAHEWDFDKNVGLIPSKITAHNGKKVWWKCQKDHSWIASIASRTGKNKTGCPFCSNKKVLPGYNDLETIFPALCKEWNFEKNTILPSEVVFGSGKKVWWKCAQGHEWQATINARTQGTGCQLCYFSRKKK